MSNEFERALRKFPDNLRTELAAVQAGATNSGAIRPGRRGGVLIAFERVKRRYDAKIANLRARSPSRAVEEAEGAITRIAAEFTAALSSGAAA
jgi:hypothetical protein